MAKQLQLRRGTTAEHSSFTGEVGELTIDTDKDTAVVHDNYQAGGFPLLREDLNNLPAGAIGANKLATGGAAYGQTLSVNDAGTGVEFQNTGPSGCQTFTSSGTWTKPAGVKYVRVQVQGGGGGGGGHCESGGAGGYAEEIIDVTSVTSVTVTVGGGGGGVTYHNVAGNGGASSFGSYCSGGGGYGAVRHGSHSGGAGNIGSGGHVNIYGGGGAGHQPYAGGRGGGSYFGGGALATHNGQAGDVRGHQAHAAPGSGGPGEYGNNSLQGADGRAGIVIVWEYS